MTFRFGKAIAYTCASLFLLLAGSCSSSYKLVMTQTREPYDESAMSPKLNQKSYSKVMVIPPSGTVRGQFDDLINSFENEFLKVGQTVISGAVTGRVVYEGKGNEESSGKRLEGGTELSDAERALIMAKSTGADAILQIGHYSWSETNIPTRFFVLPKDSGDGQSFIEVNDHEFKLFNDSKYSFCSPVLSFAGRLTDVETGEVLASLQLECPANFNLPYDYTAEMEDSKEHHGGYISEFTSPVNGEIGIAADGFQTNEARPLRYQQIDWSEAERRATSVIVQKVAQRMNQTIRDKATESQNNIRQAKIDQAKAEQAKIDQAKADKARVEQAMADQAWAEQAKADKAKADQAKADQAKADQAKADKAKAIIITRMEFFKLIPPLLAE